VSPATDIDGWEPSESGVEIILSRLSKMTTEGAWFIASVIWFASSWRITGTFSKASFEQET
jgi:hypothetical protein